MTIFGGSKFIGTMNYLAIIRKADFIDLFKYGKLNVFSSICFDGDVEAHADDDDLFGQLTRSMNLFEYSFEYMVMHFISDDGNEHPCSVSIENVRRLYTFDEEAKKEMSVSFDSRIRLHVSPWNEKFKTLHNNRLISQSKRGIDNLWAMFDLPETDRKKCESIITEDIVSEVFDELFSYRRPVGEQSIWTYLLRYDRHSYYPKNTKGYFCDYINVVCNWIAKEEKQGEDVEKAEIYAKIIDCAEDKFVLLSDMALSSPLPSRTDEGAGCKFAIAAPLFLLMKDKFRDGFYMDSKFVKYAKEFGFEGSVAVYLLGLTLGYDKTYSAYYEFIKLRIFETSDSAVEIGSLNKSDLMHHAPIAKQGMLFPTESNVNSGNDKRRPIAWLYKRKCVYYPAFDEEEIRRLKGEGLKILKSLSDQAKGEILKQGYEIPSMEEIKQIRKKYGAWSWQ